ncbi:immunoglobulin domain-containing protein [Ditylenchus destructor]|uniref:Immunoglobulin domain-containing protein n=1 Tax=Ditylenchus destructor TaxID=166010 RepID=A0AAD4MW77_9BILA|nr:immunoglobulin domain-containing protein [Ditylenchus destructor]
MINTLMCQGIDLRVKGPPSVVVQVKSGRTTGQHAQIQTNTPLSLWCQAVNERNLEVVPALEVAFRHNGVLYPAELQPDGKNATFTKDVVTLSDAGVWTCGVRTRAYGNATGNIYVYLRPVILGNSSRIDDRDATKFHFDASGVTVVRGENSRMECPVFAYPRPDIRWKAPNGKDITSQQSPRVSVRDGVLTIKNVTDADDGTYICTATNSFVHKGQSQKSDITVERRLRVKSELAWVTPLMIIIVSIVLLVAIILFCEFRKRRNEQKLLTETVDDE